jgi:hypothetical protein
MSSKDGLFSYHTLVHAVAGATVSGNYTIVYTFKHFVFFGEGYGCHHFLTVGTLVVTVNDYQILEILCNACFIIYLLM